MKKELILFYYPSKKFSIPDKELKKFEKNYSKIILYDNFYEYKSFNYDYGNKNIEKIKRRYEKLDINLNLKKIYEINNFLKKIKLKNKKKKVFVCPYFISGIILEEEIIFYELSKIYKIQFIRPELSFIKNRFILAKNFFKHPYVIKKKTNFLKKDYDLFKINYISSMQAFSERTPYTEFIEYFNKKLIKLLNLFFNFRFYKKPKEYALVILNNNKYLNSLSNNIDLKYLTNLILKKFNLELVFLLHPHNNLFKFFLMSIKYKNFYLMNKKIFILHRPKNLLNIIKNSKFIIHSSSSLSAQTLLLNKKILCLGKNEIYIKSLDNIILNIRQKNFHFIEKKMTKNDIFNINKFLINLLSVSVNSKGNFKLSTNKKDYVSLSRVKNKNKYDKDIIQNLLNAI